MKTIFRSWLWAGLAWATVLSLTAGDPVRTEQWMATLSTDAPFYEKARACQQLGEAGTVAAVPVLARYLADPHLADYARSGLEGIGEATACAALREAVGQLSGEARLGVIQSLGTLRDVEAVPLLLRVAQGEDAAAASAALLSLGRTASREAVRALRKAVRRGPEGLRGAAGTGCLLAAEQWLRLGKASEAARLYDWVRESPVSLPLRGGATRGAILARGRERVSFWMKQWRSGEPVVRQAALGAVREMPDEKLARALHVELARAKSTEESVWLLQALADCHSADSYGMLRDRLAGPDAAVRLAALRTLSLIGRPEDASPLLASLQRSVVTGAQGKLTEEQAEEARWAAAGLARLSGPTVDAEIVRALGAASEVRMRIELIRLMDERAAVAAVPALETQAGSADLAVSRAAWAALRSLAGAGEFDRLLRLALRAPEGVFGAASEAVAATAARAAEPGKVSEAMNAAWKGAASATERRALVQLWAAVGGPTAFGTLTRVWQEELDLRDAVTASLVDWPDPEALPWLLDRAENAEAKERTLARRGALRLLGVASADTTRSSAELLTWFSRVQKLVSGVDEKRLWLSSLGQFRHRAVLTMVQPMLGDAEVASEAGLCVVGLAPHLNFPDAREALRSALETVAGGSARADIREKAGSMLKALSQP